MRYLSRFTKLFLLSILLLPYTNVSSSPATCSYETYSWNVQQKKAVAFLQVSHPYSELRDDEIDPDTGCTVCMEDQVEIKFASLPAFRVCHKLASDLKQTLEYLVHSGEPIYKVVGYRVGKTRGNVDADGNRIRFSNHSYGIALDINPDQNGLYTSCREFGPNCRLIMGGAWLPGEHPASLLPDGDIVQTMQSIGFKWGGEIEGRQKDFMHFSISGY